ncbi:hypothetical protein DLM76_21230 [Leptospira yasudae]|uniref:hypothetical protein n=1 Tax=Leptospira yasudae TaxID=2202201 RepID=UPI000E59B85E|nr:hypothetical protein [Leptospira yasudae]RHX89536.1 hypothetical protein DLM76_21230 [Leptospira yasudae]
MTSEKFDQLWEISFSPKAAGLSSKYPNLKVNDSAKDDIFKVYEETRKKIHNYMVDPEGRIDRHKIASTVVYSILKILPIRGAQSQTPYELRFAKVEFMPNEVFAWHCGLSIVYSFIIEQAKRDKDQELIDSLKNGFKFPKCSHDNYEIHVLRSLYYARVNSKFDIFSFSHIFFLVEEYSKLALSSALI